MENPLNKKPRISQRRWLQLAKEYEKMPKSPDPEFRRPPDSGGIWERLRERFEKKDPMVSTE